MQMRMELLLDSVSEWAPTKRTLNSEPLHYVRDTHNMRFSRDPENCMWWRYCEVLD